MTPNDRLFPAIVAALGAAGEDGSVAPRNVLGGHVDARGRIAWISDEDETYRLRIIGGGAPAIVREIETYNPFFGCDLSYLQWWGDEVVSIYREKHRTLVWVVPVSDPDSSRMISIDDTYVVDGDLVVFESHEPGLLEAIALPTLETRLPFPFRGADRWLTLDVEHGTLRVSPRDERDRGHTPLETLRLPTAAQRGFGIPGLAAAVERALTAPYPPPPLAGLVVGCTASAFWRSHREPYRTYHAAPRPSAHSPHWLPVYWYEHLATSGRTDEARELLKFLEAISATPRPAETGWDPKMSLEEGAVALATRHVRDRARILATACRDGALPESHWCYLFDARPDGPRVPDFTDLPRAVRAVWEQLSAAKPVSFSSRRSPVKP